jgi:hypothetical protein
MLVEFEGHVGAAIRRLREALAIARDVDFDADESPRSEGARRAAPSVLRGLSGRPDPWRNEGWRCARMVLMPPDESMLHEGPANRFSLQIDLLLVERTVGIEPSTELSV